MTETHELYAVAGEALGMKVLAQELNVGLAHAYKLAADPITLDMPVRDDIARITGVVNAMAARPHAKPALIRWRLHFADLFARTVDRVTPRPLTAACVPGHTAKILAEFGDFVRVVGERATDGHISKEDAERLAIEGSEAIAAIEQLVRCALAAQDDATVAVRKIGTR